MGNFVQALWKILPLLPLQAEEEYQQGEKCISFREVMQQVQIRIGSSAVSLDMVLDAVLYKSVVESQPKMPSVSGVARKTSEEPFSVAPEIKKSHERSLNKFMDRHSMEVIEWSDEDEESKDVVSEPSLEPGQTPEQHSASD
jgi:hypothetical protein